MSLDRLLHQVLVVQVAGRRPHVVSAGAASYNDRLYGVPSPAGVVRTFHPGGIIYFSGNVSSVRQVTRLSQSLQYAAERRSGVPLLLMTDQEGGRVSRLPGPVIAAQPSARSFEGNTTAGRRSALAVGQAMRAMGVLVNLAPDADVDTVGDAGVIGDRSFGSTAGRVSAMVGAQICGYHRSRIATTIKHWPGHGSTRVDSHEALPHLHLTLPTWRRVHEPPFRAGIAAGTDLLMVGHLAYARLDPSGRPASLSRIMDHRWLRDRLHFRGVVITDALTMGALKTFGNDGRLAVTAFRAGADLLLLDRSPRAAVAALKAAVAAGQITRAQLESSVLRVLRLEDRLGLLPGPRTLARCP